MTRGSETMHQTLTPKRLAALLIIPGMVSCITALVLIPWMLETAGSTGVAP